MKTTLLIFSFAVSACGASTYQSPYIGPNGVENYTHRKGVGYENTTDFRDSSYAFRSCRRENRKVRQDADAYCRCITTPLDKRGPECYVYGGFLYAGAMVPGGYASSLYTFPGAINTTDGSKFDPRFQVQQPAKAGAVAQASASTTSEVSSPWKGEVPADIVRKKDLEPIQRDLDATIDQAHTNTVELNRMKKSAPTEKK